MAELYFSSKKVNLDELHQEFMKHATQIDGFWYIGDPVGEDAYSYLRVSSDRQMEGSGIPRQIENVHNAAIREHLRIPWELIYGDDESGFFLERKGLTKLLEHSAERKLANYVVIEDIKRLSRSNQWHQGYLQEQFEDYRGIKLVFYDAINSPLEFMFKGYVAAESAKYSNQIMKDGIRLKAEAGFVTGGGTVLFGYERYELKGADRIVSRVKKQTKYRPKGPIPESENGCEQYGECYIVEEMYDLVSKGTTTRQVGKLFDEKYGPPRDAVCWDSAAISRMIQNPAYKGEYAHGRYGNKTNLVRLPDGTVEKRRTSFIKPESEWTTVKIPAIVTPQVWEAANRMLDKNKQMSSRNGQHREYMLTGLIFCAECNYAWHGTTATNGQGNKFFYYKCSTNLQRKNRAVRGVTCSQKTAIQVQQLNDAVWSIIRNLIYEPETLMQYIEDDYHSQANQEIQTQIGYIEGQIAKSQRNIEIKYEMVEKGYMQVDEYGPLYKLHTENVKQWNAEIAELNQRLMTREKADELKNQILQLADYARQFEHQGEDIPEDAKLAIIKMAVNAIYVDGNRGTMRVVGQIGDHVYSFFGRGKGSNGGGSDPTVRRSLPRLR